MSDSSARPCERPAAAPFESILFLRARDRPSEPREAPAFFHDLNLDQIVAAIIRGGEDYDLASFFHLMLTDAEAIQFRHEVMGDMERPSIAAAIEAFSAAMRTMRSQLSWSERLRDPRQRQCWFLDAANAYCAGVAGLVRDLAAARPASTGLRALTAYLEAYVASDDFRRLCEQAQKLKTDLASIRYCVDIDQLRVRVRKYAGEADYARTVDATFDRFKEEDPGARSFALHYDREMNHVETRILDLVVALYPDTFAELAAFMAANAGFVDQPIRAFDREIQFYRFYLDHIAKLKALGLAFCYPAIAPSPVDTYLRDGFDLALAGKLAAQGISPVLNDVRLDGAERIIIVTGPNQGGKTTFARMLGQAHYLAALGCPVPGSEARLLLVDRLFTHFERGENASDLIGKLQDDLVRLHAILTAAGPRSLVILNEIFTSTTLKDATALSRRLMDRVAAIDLACVWVTFVEDLASAGEKTMSMVSTVESDDPTKRTFRIVRGPAQGVSHALAIAKRHALTSDQIRRRLGP